MSNIVCNYVLMTKKKKDSFSYIVMVDSSCIHYLLTNCSGYGLNLIPIASLNESNKFCHGSTWFMHAYA